MNKDSLTTAKNAAGFFAKEALTQTPIKAVNNLRQRNPKIWVASLVILVILSAIGTIAIVGVLQKKKEVLNEVPVMVVTTAQAQMQPINRTLNVVGTITAWDPLAIGAEVNGLRIDNIYVDEGSRVHKGQVLATLNSAVLRAALEQSQAKVRASHANHGKALQPNRPEDIGRWRAVLAQAEANIAQVEADLVEAQANLDNARSNSRRYKDLVVQGAVSAQDAEAKITAEKTAEAQVKSMTQRIQAAKFGAQQARESLKMAERGGRLEDVQISQATMAELEANVRQLQAQIDQTIIRAPSDGLIIKRDAHIGDITSAGDTLFNMVRDNRLELKAQVPEVDLAKLAPGQEVTIQYYGHGNETLKGTVREISPFVDANSRLGIARIDLPSNAALKPGMFVHGLVKLGLQPALTMPETSVLSRDNRSFVYILDNNRARYREVQTGSRSGTDIEIVQGLKPGETVIVDGAGFLKDGDLVEVGK
jgi:HlyD family secretion protein